MQAAKTFMAAGFVIGMFFGQPQIGAVIGHALGGGSKESAPTLTTRDQTMADELARTLSENRGGLWLGVALLGCLILLAVRVLS